MELKLTTLILAASVAFALGHPTTSQLVSLKTSSNLRGTNSLGMFDGKPTTIENHPYIVAIHIFGDFNCEGTIVSDSWVVTLADPIAGLGYHQVTVKAGSDDAEHGVTYRVNRIIIHPKFAYPSFDYDYGCVQIQGTFKWSDKIKPAKLPSQDPKANTNLVVAGWGGHKPPPPTSPPIPPLTEVGDEPPSNQKLLEGNMKWLDKKVCSKIYSAAGVSWTDRLACTYNKGKTTLCQGDWGDSFVSNDVFYGIFIAGITDGFCTKSAKPVLLSDISTVSAWIKQITGAKLENKN